MVKQPFSLKRHLEKKVKYVNFIKSQRIDLQFTQTQLAKQLGVSRQTIHALESGRKQPSLFIAVKMAKFFHRKVEDLFRYQ